MAADASPRLQLDATVWACQLVFKLFHFLLVSLR